MPRTDPPRLAIGVAFALAGAWLAACGDTQPTESVMQSPGATDGNAFTLVSPEFADGGAIPARYSCDGDDVSPPLEWRGTPEAAVTLALLVEDPDAGGFVHWVVYNVDASASGGLPADWSREAEFQGSNSFGSIGYRGPCPPSGEHRYVFTLLALDTMLELAGSPTADRLTDAVAGHVLAEARLGGIYRRSR